MRSDRKTMIIDVWYDLKTCIGCVKQVERKKFGGMILTKELLKQLL